MSDATRRRFLALAGAGTALGVAAVAAPSAARSESATAVPADAPTALAAYVQDVHSGQIALLVEGREVVVTDHDLADRIARAFARA